MVTAHLYVGVRMKSEVEVRAPGTRRGRSSS
eukprot:CAMPEP_0184398982 /NCGR_PEP_ID=MMETSP0007-20130409/68337_1 /TAXON_ID=97485 /ORGANISM="Prymnesium parvum, Strain Texoma1" /LENGTH=30 /DNA_ID= /DNA_START= /DNA_END= /DNA_ORIENTATION=